MAKGRIDPEQDSEELYDEPDMGEDEEELEQDEEAEERDDEQEEDDDDEGAKPDPEVESLKAEVARLRELSAKVWATHPSNPEYALAQRKAETIADDLDLDLDAIPRTKDGDIDLKGFAKAVAELATKKAARLVEERIPEIRDGIARSTRVEREIESLKSEYPNFSDDEINDVRKLMLAGWDRRRAAYAASPDKIDQLAGKTKTKAKPGRTSAAGRGTPHEAPRRSSGPEKKLAPREIKQLAKMRERANKGDVDSELQMLGILTDVD